MFFCKYNDPIYVKLEKVATTHGTGDSCIDSVSLAGRHHVHARQRQEL